jgi:hypothetical protein
VDVSGEVALGKAGLFGALLVVAWGMTFLYYGTALLFFEEKSFFREKMAAVIFVIYVVYSGYLVAVLPVEGFRQTVVTPIQLGLMALSLQRQLSFSTLFPGGWKKMILPGNLLF